MATLCHSVGVLEAASAISSQDAVVGSNFAWAHMRAASIFRDQAAGVESEHAKTPTNDAYEHHRSYVSGAIMSATASLEALINELFIDPHIGLREHFPDFDTKFWGDANNRGIEGKTILAKYQFALNVLGLSPLSVDGQAYVAAEGLIGLRNSLVHFKPNWDSDRPQTMALRKKLEGRYSASPWSTPTDDFVAKQSMSADCARWAVRSALGLMRAFHERSGLASEKMSNFWKLDC